MRSATIAIALLLLPAAAVAQHYQTDFPAEEFKARHARVFDRIGAQAVAVVQGVSQTEGYTLPRQHNTFYYLSGIETPGAYLQLDGRTKTVTIYLPPRNPRLEAAEGRVISAEDVELVKRIAGVDAVRPVSDMVGTNWPLTSTGAADGRGAGRGGQAIAIYAEFSPAENQGQSRGELVAAETARANDFWDGAPTRQRRFAELLRTRHPRSEIRNLTPILDELRSIKSPREIAMIRRASQIAGLGLMEAMRSTEPGVTEYQLDAAAHYVFKVNDARLEAYRSITAAGTENINNMHYFRTTGTLKDGDLVLMDYAPDYRYYVSDIGRVFPVNGRYNAWQRELLQFVLEYHKAVMTRIRPGVTPMQIRQEAATAMEAVFARTKFSKPAYEKAARTLVETGGGVFSHTVGMAVHDVGTYVNGPLKPGQVFSIDPQLWVREENLYLRFEDTIVVTETGYENFTAFLPMELDDMERLVAEEGVVQKVPPIPASTASEVWTFDRLDSVGGHPTKILGSPRIVDSPLGKVTEFDGVDDALFVDVHPLAGAGTFTWEAIFRPDGGAREQRWFHLQETGSENRMLFEIRVEGDRWFLDSFNFSTTGTATLMNKASLHPLGAWYHVAAVYDGREFRNYVNGVQDGAAEVRLSPQGPGRSSIGVRINLVNYFRGAIHSARFTRRALAPGEFLALPATGAK